MVSYRTLLYEKTAEGIAWVTLNRPRVLNALNTAMRDELWEVLLAVRDDPEVRVAIFRGAGTRAFCSGADVSEFGTAPSYVEAREARHLRDLWALMLSLEKPLIAAVHGYTLGAGLEMSLLCDLRLAAEGARLGTPEVSLGYIPSAGGTQTLPRVIRLGAALELILTGEPVDAAEAYRLGLVHRVVPWDRLYPEAEGWARRLLASPPPALGLAKRAVVRGLELSLEQGLALERQLVLQAASSPEAEVGRRAWY